MKELTIISGIKRTEIHDYLLTLGASVLGDLYRTPSWTIRLSPEISRALGSIILPETKVTFTAEENICDKLVEDYRLHFLSAGA